MQRATEWLDEHKHTFTVHGHLIGTKASPQSRSAGVVVLRRRIKEAGPDTPWKIRDFIEVLSDAQAAHQDLLAIQKQLEEADKGT
jgi:hypothetical protein